MTASRSPPPSLAGVWAKIERADEHAQLLEREVRCFFDRDVQPVTASVGYFDPESGWHVVYGIVNEHPPPRLGVILGDLVHNVRSALDHLVWQLVLWNGETPKRGSAGSTFPFAMTKSAWKATKKRSLLGVSEKHRAILQQAQPYKGGNGPENTITAALRDLSNVDKHQVVHTTLATIRDPGAGPHRASFRVVEGDAQIVQEQVRYGEGFEHGTPLMRARTEPANSGVKVEVDGTIPFDVAFGKRRARWESIKKLPQIVRLLVREFEADFAS
jgi:hypothetical protein